MNLWREFAVSVMRYRQPEVNPPSDETCRSTHCGGSGGRSRNGPVCRGTAGEEGSRGNSNVDPESEITDSIAGTSEAGGGAGGRDDKNGGAGQGGVGTADGERKGNAGGDGTNDGGGRGRRWGNRIWF